MTVAWNLKYVCLYMSSLDHPASKTFTQSPDRHDSILRQQLSAGLKPVRFCNYECFQHQCTLFLKQPFNCSGAQSKNPDRITAVESSFLKNAYRCSKMSNNSNYSTAFTEMCLRCLSVNSRTLQTGFLSTSLQELREDKEWILCVCWYIGQSQ